MVGRITLRERKGVRLSPHGMQTYAPRSQTTERVLADAKEKDGMRYSNHSGTEVETPFL